STVVKQLYWKGENQTGRLKTDAVIENIDAIEYEEQHREAKFGIAVGVVDGLLEPLVQDPAARQPGQLVVQRVGGRERLGALATVDVGQRSGQRDRTAPANRRS